jgi:ribosomal protein S18 acetylase RimI-like enzyme
MISAVNGPLILREATQDDRAFLEAMLVEAVNWDPRRDRLAREAILAEPQHAHYIAGWKRPGDIGIIVELNGEPVGAAWLRSFAADDPGYGFIDERTPEVSIGVVDEHRGRGIGGALLEALAHQATQAGHAALSLSVEPDNPAVALYERQGFVAVAASGRALTMRKDLGS